MTNKTKISGPIAIVGMAFRFPGDVSTEQEFWQLLIEGRDAVTEVGPERWATEELRHTNRAEPGRSVTFSAGVISEPEAFDAEFFGISPREAGWLDPQQRLLLELGWEAIEDSGRKPEDLTGSDCAVFVGLSALDHGVKGIADLASISSHTMTGNTLSMASNRLSYMFDLQGPSMTVDTACSSALVALHQACQSLRNGEAPMAMVGSASLLLHPYPFVGFTKAAMISSRGRCRTFDASADGYVRAEGGAVVMLKTLAQAQEDGDRVHAIILASGVNADGGDKSGITIPSSAGQSRLMQQVLRQSGISADQIDYIEAHGTGTAAGDPVEAKAIGAVYGKGRDKKLPVGSVKTNLGHLEAASGMAGLVKTVLMLKNRELTPSLHFETPNPDIPFDDLNLHVVTERTSLAGSDPVIMAVNSFGFGGANAHVILESAPHMPRDATLPQTLLPFILSAKNEAALTAMAAQYAHLLDTALPEAAQDMAWSAMHRQLHAKRLAVMVTDARNAAEKLRRFARGEAVPGMIREDVLSPGSVAFIYSGNGAQWAGMGQKLLRESPRFTEILKELDAAMTEAGFSVLRELQLDAASSRLDDTSIAQPLLFAMQVAITTMLRERGVVSAAAAGHSVGEVAAAWAAGAMTLEQAIKLVVTRSAAQAETRGLGRMAAVGMSEAVMREVLGAGDYPDIEIAGINSPANVTLAGPLAQLNALRTVLQARGLFFVMLDLDYAFHSKVMNAAKTSFLKRIDTVACYAADIDFVSTVTGSLKDGSTLDAAYWWDNVRQPVQFQAAIEALVTRGCDRFVEIGPHAILQRYLSETLGASGSTGRALPTLRKQDDGLSRLEETALTLHMLAATPDIAALEKTYFPVPGRFVAPPAYAWQREFHTLPKTPESYGLIERARAHPLLGWRLKDQEAAWENVIDETIQPYLKDHRVAGSIVFPAAGYVEIALAAAREWFGGEDVEIEEFTIFAPVILSDGHPMALRAELSPRDGTLRILSRARLSEDAWGLNVSCRLLGAPTRAAHTDIKTLDEQSGVFDDAAHYALTSAVGLEYGPTFQGLVRGWVRDDRLDGVIALPGSVSDAGAYRLHPVLLDTCFQALTGFFRTEIEAGDGMQLLPVKIGRLRFFGGAMPARFEMRLDNRHGRTIRCTLVLRADGGRIVGIAEECAFRVSSMQRRRLHQPAAWYMDMKVMPHPAAPSDRKPETACFGEDAKKFLHEAFPEATRKNYFEQAAPLLDALVAIYSYEAFAGMDEVARQAAFNSDASISSGQEFFRFWLVTRLKRAGFVREGHNGFVLDAAQAPPPSGEVWRALLGDFPELLPELLPLGRVGRNLAAILSDNVKEKAAAGRASETMYEDSPAYAAVDQALQRSLTALARNWPANRRLRVLEISAAPGTLPHCLADAAKAGAVDYVVGALDNSQFDQASAELATLTFVTIVLFDAETLRMPEDARVPEEFDVVILRHWLHQVESISALRALMSDGALLVAAERQPNDATDFIFGGNADWWRSGGRLQSRLLTPQDGVNLLTTQGFENAEFSTELADSDSRSGSYLLFANSPAKVIDKQAPDTACWLILDDSDDERQGNALIAALRAVNQTVIRHAAKFQSPDEVAQLIEECAHNPGSIDNVVFLVAKDAESNVCVTGLYIIQALTRCGENSAKLWVVTRGGMTDPPIASVWGMMRVAMNEQPQLRCTLIDIDEQDAVRAAELLRRDLLEPDGETEIILAADVRRVLRLRSGMPAQAAETEAPRRFALDFHVPGQLRNLLWLARPERVLADDEIEVETKVTGLNFRDVMYAMGLLPDEAVENGFSGASLGLEFSGVVGRVGSGVANFKPGDAVMGFGPSCFASHVVTKAAAVTAKPAGWTFAQAATVPTAFFTVYYALRQLAQLQPGEKILIHGAAGGVGIAAIQIARHLGAEIFATAGTDEKRDFASLIGADHVFDSRSLAFADDILALAGGVDVVLNSLAGEAINRNFRVLKPFGRFLELGKRDFFENTQIGLRPFKDNISYFGIDADQLLAAKPQLVSRLFAEMMALFADGVLTPLPYRLFNADKIVDAFRHMQQARHIGKIVVDLDRASVPVATEGKLPHISFHPDASYLVTGGLSGFGFESACWLAARGAGQVILVGRRGRETPGAAEAIQRIEALGARVEIFACDIADCKALANVFAAIDKICRPLRGILHAAMVLDDALMDNLDAARFEKVFAPKVEGARNLHDLSTGLPLDHFIIYSSVTTVIGNPGQGNYVAANTWLEAFALWRRSQGLPAICVGWGPIGDAGYLARNTALKEGLSARLGARPLETAQALEQLERVILSNTAQVTIGDFDVATLARFLPSAAGPRFDDIRGADGQSETCGDNADIDALMAGKTTSEIRQVIRQIIITEAGKILSIGPERIDTGIPINDLGMDSLMTVELALAIEQRFGINLAAMELSGNTGSIDRIYEKVAEKLQSTGDAQTADATTSMVSAVLARHEAISEEEVSRTVTEFRDYAQASTGRAA